MDFSATAVGAKLNVAGEIEKQLPGFEGDFLFPEHHESHAASAFFPSPFEEAALLTLDGVGQGGTGPSGIPAEAEDLVPPFLQHGYQASAHQAGAADPFGDLDAGGTQLCREARGGLGLGHGLGHGHGH